MITLQELLTNRGLDMKCRIKLVRHKDNNQDLEAMYKYDKALFFKYQETQKKDVFNSVDYIVSFLGYDNAVAMFIGVFKVLGKEVADGFYMYDLQDVSGFEDLKERVIIKWKNPIVWHQWLQEQTEVVELQQGLQYKRFTDYAEIILTYPELCEIIQNRYADWYNALSTVNGIYLITDLGCGKLYVGSAYGEQGIWGRWTDYVKTCGHGNNKALMELCKDKGYAAKNFQFSVLMLLSKTATSEQIVRNEQLFKRKLGTNAFGLNYN